MLSFNFLVMSILLSIYLLSIILLRKRKREFLFFYTIFFIYLSFEVKYTLFPLPLTESTLELLRSASDNASVLGKVNLIPFNSIFTREMMLNIVLTVPFGFGYYFVFSRKQHFIVLSVLIGLLIETIQLLISLSINFAYRIVDINDFILNFIGAIVGFSLFFLFSIIIKKMYANRAAKGFMKYVYMKTNANKLNTSTYTASEQHLPNMPDKYSH